MSSKSLTSGQLRSFRSQVAALKAKGLVSKRIDARSQKPTRYMLAQVQKFAPALSGKAQVVTVKKAGGKTAIENAKAYDGSFVRKGRKLLVPKSDKAEQIRFDEKTGKVKRYGKTAQGERYSSVIEPKGKQSLASQRFPEGPGIMYRIPFGRVGSFTFDNLKDLYDFMLPYEQSANPYNDWQNYVEIIRINPSKVRKGFSRG